MREHIGEVTSLFRYPVKSMRGEAVAETFLGWHGLAGDRRLALRRVHDRSGFPWLTASRLPTLLCYTPLHDSHAADETLPTRVRLPEGEEVPLFDPALTADVARRADTPVDLVHLNRGIFDEAAVSVITSASVASSCRLADLPADVRRFRPNIVLDGQRLQAFAEDAWIGGVLTFGTAPDAAALLVTNSDVRCAMVTYDPDTTTPSPALLKRLVQERGNRVGVYAAVARRGRIATGQPVYFERSTVTIPGMGYAE